MANARRTLTLAALLCSGWAFVGCGGPSEEGPTTEEVPAPLLPGDSQPPANVTPTSPAPTETAPSEPSQPSAAAPQVDADGVAMLMTPNPEGSAWALGAGDPNAQGGRFDLDGDKARQQTEDGITYWTTTGHKVNYASGAPSGLTVRLNIMAGGGSQQYTWKSGALEHGYLGSPKDLKNFEATAYVRVRGSNGTHTSMNWKMRGGSHSGSNPALASCVEMGVPYGDEPPKAGRELNHPTYDTFALSPQFPFSLQEGKWLAVKVVSYLVPGGTQNRLYLDTEPFDANGRPRNAFRLFTEWTDRDGESTGKYSQAATWAGWRTTFRVDGWKNVDFALLSAREILPPQS